MKKTTLELPGDLVVAAKKRAAETGSTVRALIERGLRRELGARRAARGSRRPARIRWVVADGGLPEGVDLADRAGMHEWLRRQR